jgi:SAM-dependent methyltransferase
MPPRWEVARDDLAFRYLRGDGIEIGAYYLPQRVRDGVRVRYVDYTTADVLATLDVRHPWAVETDVIDEAEKLANFEDESIDFVIANHVVEHTEDPVAAIKAFVRVLRPGGVVFITLPDPRHSFDRHRPRTTLEHVLRDHREGPEVSRRDHYEEWARYIEGVSGDRAIAERADQFAAEEERNHFHVWEPDTFLELLLALDLPIQIEAVQATEPEFSVIFRKREPAA